MPGHKNKLKYEEALKEYVADPTITMTYLAEKYNFTRQCFKKWLVGKGIEIKKRQTSVEKSKKIKEAISLYKKGLSAANAAKKVGISHSTLMGYLKKECPKVIRKTFRRPNYKMNENYFEKIDSREKAYWLGFIAADGCVRENGVTIELNSIDVNHLEKFNKALETNIKLYARKNRPQIALTVYKEKIANDLMKLGCVINKTENGFIDENAINGYEMDFIRGYVDGDGYIEKNYKKNRLIITSKTPKMIESIMKMLQKYSPRLENCKTFYRIHVDRKNDFFNILNDMYKDAPVYLDRKYSTYLDRINAHLSQNVAEDLRNGLERN